MFCEPRIIEGTDINKYTQMKSEIITYEESDVMIKHCRPEPHSIIVHHHHSPVGLLYIILHVNERIHFFYLTMKDFGIYQE